MVSGRPAICGFGGVGSGVFNLCVSRSIGLLPFLFLRASTVGHPHRARRSPPPPQDCRRFMFVSEGQSFQFQFCGGLNSGIANDVFRRKVKFEGLTS
jgi:hypothetical protein